MVRAGNLGPALPGDLGDLGSAEEAEAVLRVIEGERKIHREANHSKLEETEDHREKPYAASGPAPRTREQLRELLAEMEEPSSGNFAKFGGGELR